MAGEAYGQPNIQSGGTHGDAATQSVRALLFSSCSTAKIVNMEAKPQNWKRRPATKTTLKLNARVKSLPAMCVLLGGFMKQKLLIGLLTWHKV